VGSREGGLEVKKWTGICSFCSAETNLYLDKEWGGSVREKRSKLVGRTSRGIAGTGRHVGRVTWRTKETSLYLRNLSYSILRTCVGKTSHLNPPFS